MSVNDIVAVSTTRVIASPYQSGSEGRGGVRHAYAIRSTETEAWGTFDHGGNVGRWDWTVRLEDAVVFSSQADARLAAQNYFPLDRTEVVRVNLPLRSPVGSSASEASRRSMDDPTEGEVPVALSFSKN
jgi:hypothetical protein